MAASRVAEVRLISQTVTQHLVLHPAQYMSRYIFLYILYKKYTGIGQNENHVLNFEFSQKEQ